MKKYYFNIKQEEDSLGWKITVPGYSVRDARDRILCEYDNIKKLTYAGNN